MRLTVRPIITLTITIQMKIIKQKIPTSFEPIDKSNLEVEFRRVGLE